jgi:hypothetical protein
MSRRTGGRGVAGGADVVPAARVPSGVTGFSVCARSAGGVDGGGSASGEGAGGSGVTGVTATGAGVPAAGAIGIVAAGGEASPIAGDGASIGGSTTSRPHQPRTSSRMRDRRASATARRQNCQSAGCRKK